MRKKQLQNKNEGVKVCKSCYYFVGVRVSGIYFFIIWIYFVSMLVYFIY